VGGIGAQTEQPTRGAKKIRLLRQKKGRKGHIRDQNCDSWGKQKTKETVVVVVRKVSQK
jgi:hypothetical protein